MKLSTPCDTSSKRVSKRRKKSYRTGRRLAHSPSDYEQPLRFGTTVLLPIPLVFESCAFGSGLTTPFRGRDRRLRDARRVATRRIKSKSLLVRLCHCMHIG